MILGEFKKIDFFEINLQQNLQLWFAKTLRDQLTLCDGYSPPNPTRSGSPCSLLMPLNLVHEVCRPASILAKMHAFLDACIATTTPMIAYGDDGYNWWRDMFASTVRSKSNICIVLEVGQNDPSKRKSNAVATDIQGYLRVATGGRSGIRGVPLESDEFFLIDYIFIPTYFGVYRRLTCCKTKGFTLYFFLSENQGLSGGVVIHEKSKQHMMVWMVWDNRLAGGF